MFKKILLMVISFLSVSSAPLIVGTKLPEDKVVQLVNKPVNNDTVKSYILIEAKTGKVLDANKKI